MLLLLTACMGFDQSTLIDELRVMAIKSEPLEVRLADFYAPMMELSPHLEQQGEEDEEMEQKSPEIQMIVANPIEEAIRVAVWQCTNFGDGCLEAEAYAENPSDWVQLLQPTDSLLTVPLNLNPMWGALLTNGPELLPITGLWVLACIEGSCDILERAATGEWDMEAFRDPFSIGKSLPLLESSIASKQLLVSNFDSFVPRLENPIIQPQFDQLPVITTEESLELSFDIELLQQDADRSSIYGYATVGGFSSNSFANNALSEAQQSKTITWFPPEEVTEETGELYVIVNDGLGGVDFWTSDIVTEPQ